MRHIIPVTCSHKEREGAREGGREEGGSERGSRVSNVPAERPQSGADAHQKNFTGRFRSGSFHGQLPRFRPALHRKEAIKDRVEERKKEQASATDCATCESVYVQYYCLACKHA